MIPFLDSSIPFFQRAGVVDVVLGAYLQQSPEGCKLLAMNRREALKATVGVLVAGRTAMLGFDLRPCGGYVVFFDPKLTGKDYPYKPHDGFPPNTVFQAVDVPPGKTLDDAIRIFHLHDGAAS